MSYILRYFFPIISSNTLHDENFPKHVALCHDNVYVAQLKKLSKEEG